jgi:ABC-type transport system involved in cytochrome bd biosynthesis fused ATPase/permease subunit
MEGRTTIVISHDLMTVREATSIAVLEHGQTTEYGTHRELLVRGGTYARLYRSHHPEEQSREGDDRAGADLHRDGRLRAERSSLTA